jgi:hypothetical protein
MSIFDYHLILNEMDLEDVREGLQERENKISDEDVREIEDAEPKVLQELRTALPSLFGVPYLQIYTEEKPAVDNNEDLGLGWQMESYVQHGIERALNRMGEGFRNVNVSIEIDLGDPLEEVASKDLTELDHHTLRQLRRVGHISNDEFAEAWVEIKEQRE